MTLYFVEPGSPGNLWAKPEIETFEIRERSYGLSLTPGWYWGPPCNPSDSIPEIRARLIRGPFGSELAAIAAARKELSASTAG